MYNVEKLNNKILLSPKSYIEINRINNNFISIYDNSNNVPIPNNDLLVSLSSKSIIKNIEFNKSVLYIDIEQIYSTHQANNVINVLN